VGIKPQFLGRPGSSLYSLSYPLLKKIFSRRTVTKNQGAAGYEILPLPTVLKHGYKNYRNDE
jgi:hypothetical protein